MTRRKYLIGFFFFFFLPLVKRSSRLMAEKEEGVSLMCFLWRCCCRLTITASKSQSVCVCVCVAVVLWMLSTYVELCMCVCFQNLRTDQPWDKKGFSEVLWIRFPALRLFADILSIKHFDDERKPLNPYLPQKENRFHSLLKVKSND